LSNRIERERLRLREEVLKAAIHLAEREGWSYVSIRRIAEAIEYSTTKIYDLFENKDHLVLELLRKGFTMLAEQLEQARQSRADAHEQILALTNAYCRFAWNNGAYYRIMYGMDGVPFGVQETWQEGLRIGEIAKESLKLLHPNDDDESLNQLVYILWGTLHGICSLFLAGRLYGDKEHAEKLAKQAVMAYVNEQRSEG
jgi:AcrR family transcriptional regulator